MRRTDVVDGRTVARGRRVSITFRMVAHDQDHPEERDTGTAAEEGDERIVRLLLHQRANVALAASDGGTALMRACFSGHDQCARAHRS